MQIHAFENVALVFYDIFKKFKMKIRFSVLVCIILCYRCSFWQHNNNGDKGNSCSWCKFDLKIHNNIAIYIIVYNEINNIFKYLDNNILKPRYMR